LRVAGVSRQLRGVHRAAKSEGKSTGLFNIDPLMR